MKELNFGVNYTPSKNWFYSWLNIDLHSIDDDFAAISNIGCNHIRLHLIWQFFQPNANYVEPKLLTDLNSVLDLASKHGLQVEITPLNGWMSGFWFLPNWIKDRHIITDPAVIDAEIYYFSELQKAIGNHPALMGIDIGNEINMFGWLKEFTIEEGDEWLIKLTDKLNQLFPNKKHVLGVDHQPWFRDDYFSRKTLANVGYMTSLHTWGIFTGAQKYGLYSDECLGLSEFNIELANAYSENPDRKVWIQEFSVTQAWTDEIVEEKYLRETILRAYRSENLFGVTWWCSHDISREFTEFGEGEYSLGLFDVNNNPKPFAKAFKILLNEMKNGLSAPKLKTGTAIIIKENESFNAWKYGEAFSNFIKNGEHVKFVLQSKSQDKTYLKNRNINRLIEL